MKCMGDSCNKKAQGYSSLGQQGTGGEQWGTKGRKLLMTFPPFRNFTF